MYHIFIYSPVDGHLCCFRFLVIACKAAAYIHALDLCGHVFLFVLGRYLEVDLLGCKINSCVTFQETAQLLQVTSHFAFPRATHEGSTFSIFSPTVVIVCLFYYNHSNGYGMVFHCSFNLHFLVQMTNVIKHLFMFVLTVSL